MSGRCLNCGRTPTGEGATVCSSGFSYASPSGAHDGDNGLTLVQVGTGEAGRSEQWSKKDDSS